MEAVLDVILVLFVIQCALGQEVPLNSNVERSALLDLRSSLGLRTGNWPIKGEPCTNWTGVHCQNGRVVEINISGLKRTRLGRLNPRFSVESLGNLTSLQSFNASGFFLPASIPEWFGYRLSSLQVLDLRSCSISGPIPVSLGNMTRLNELFLYDNNLTGNVPATLGQLMELAVLDLSHNSLTGSVPSSLSLLGNISRLDLSSNSLSGPVPIEFGSISGLQFLNLSDNSLIGSIPLQLGGLLRLIELDMSENSLEGPLPDRVFSSLPRLQILLLSGNKLDGAIPGEMWSMPNLHLLDLSSNRFTGVLSNFSLNGSTTDAYAVFNFSNNLLYGPLPTSIIGTMSLIDLSSNYLQGKVLDTSRRNITLDRNCLQVVPNQRSLEGCSLFYAERGLSFDNFGAQQPTQAPVLEPEPKKGRQWIYILVGLLGGLGFIVVLVLLMVLVLRKCNKGRVNQKGTANVGPIPGGSSPLPKDPAILSGLGEPFTYDQLLRATGGFSEINLIKNGHSGDLYRGFLESGIPVVIKRIDLRSFKKESYLQEVELFSKVLHGRLVPLLGHSFENENENLLVYKYMPHGDLASSLFRVTTSDDDGLLSLDWITRLKIAIGAAEALSYLHHECNPPLVHRDVQASSILLDDKFEVRLGSLSEVHAQEGDSHQSLLSKYMRKGQASESGLSGLSSTICAYDAYCFGKVLLELVTGKLGISGTNDASTKEWLDHTLPHISLYDKELVTKIIDPSLMIDEDLLEEVWAMAIVARSCLHPRPSKRPPMKYVLKALENPLKVVRQNSSSSSRMRTSSSRRYWTTTFFGSWRRSSSDGGPGHGHMHGEGTSGSRQTGRVGSNGSNRIEHSFSAKRVSNEIFPEPLEMRDLERQDEP